jgi:hypothetical protein
MMREQKDLKQIVKVSDTRNTHNEKIRSFNALKLIINTSFTKKSSNQLQSIAVCLIYQNNWRKKFYYRKDSYCNKSEMTAGPEMV